jgi:predicted Fe-S protein YdhL (DUF1289 family)
MPEQHKKTGNYENKQQTFRVPWSRLSQKEKDAIMEKSKLKKEEEQRKLNKKAADIMMGRQRTIDNSW